MTNGVEPGSGPRLPSRGWAAWALPALAFAVGFANFPLQALGAKFDHLPGDPADNRLNNFILEHGYNYITGRAESFWDAPMFYPVAGVTSWSDAHIGMLPFYAATRSAGLSPERAFQGHFVLCFVLNFVAAVWAIRRLGFGPVGAAVGAYVFAFGLPLSGQLQHTQLYPRFLVPPAIVFAWEYLRSPRAWRLVAAAWCLAGQTFLTVYIGYFLVVFLGVAGLVTVIRFGRWVHWRGAFFPGWRDWLLSAAGVAAAALAVLWLAQQHRQSGSEHDVEQIRLFAPKPTAWLTPPANSGAFPELAEWTRLGTGMPNSGEQQVCPGLLPLAAVTLGALVIFTPRRLGDRGSVVAACAVSALLVGLLFTQYGETWYYERIAGLPGARGIRAIGRVVLVLLFPAGVVMAAGADALVIAAARGGRGCAACAVVLSLVATVGDQWLSPSDGPRQGWRYMRCPLGDVLAGQARVAEAIRSHPEPKLVYVFPDAVPGGAVVAQSAAMRAAQDCGLPCVNGWSAHTPRGWDFFPGPREVTVWLTEKNAVAPELLAGLVYVKRPTTE